MVSEQIPIFGLYGEPRDVGAAIGIHIEEIADRSKGQNWRIKPHRHARLFQILCLFEGRCDIHLDEERHQIDDFGLITIPIATVHSFSFKPNSQGVVVSLSDESLSIMKQFHDTDYLTPLLEQPAVIDISTDGDRMQQLGNLIELLRTEFSSANDAKHTSLLLLANLLLIVIKRQLDQQAMSTRRLNPRMRMLAAFQQLVEDHFRDRWRVSDYARALNVSASTLNRMSHSFFGMNAKSLILSRVITEAKRRLIYTQQPLDQIAYQLGFKDPAYFSRAFKKLENIPPSEYRKLRQL